MFFTLNFLLLTANCFSQSGAAINTTGTAADASAGLDIQFNNKGLLIPRMTTAERNVIQNPAEGLQIYNLDCHNLDIYNGTSWVAVNPIVASLSISANPGGAICAGTSVTFTATPVNGGAAPSYQWKLNGGDVGTNSATYTNSSLNNGDQISCELTSNAACVSGNPAVSNVLTMIVAQPPTVADAGTDQSLCNVSTTTLSANSPTVGTGLWSVVSGSATISNPSSPTSGVTDLVTGTATLQWTISNSPCTASTDVVDITVVEPPTVANAGSDINPACDATTATLNGNAPTIGTGSWSVVSGTATITNPSSPTSGVTGLAIPGTATLRWTISNSPCAASTDDVVITTTSCYNCGVETVNFTYNGLSVTYGTVNGDYNGGQYCWLDRNLGASVVATAVDHVDGYGDLFQWGRLDDGHQVRSPLSGTTTTLSNNDNPNHSNFILTPNSPYDWRSGQNNSLWQGASGINNPCPTGWRLPTETELNNERTSWANNNYNGAINSSLHMPAAGFRDCSDGSFIYEGSSGYYWSSTVSSTNARYFYFNSSIATMLYYYRAYGYSVRCLRD